MWRRKHKDVFQELQRAVVHQNGSDFVRLCQKHRSEIASAFRSWQMVPEALRSDARRVQDYGQTLGAVAQCFVQEFGDRSLMESLSPPRDDRVLAAWEATLEVVDTLKAAGAYQDALKELDKLVAITSSVEIPSEADNLLALAHGRQGEVHVLLGDLKEGRRCMELALRAAARAGELSIVLLYMENLFELADRDDDINGMLGWSNSAAEACRGAGLVAEHAKWQLREIGTAATRAHIGRAFEDMRQHLDVFRRLLKGDPLYLSQHLNEAGEILRQAGHFDEARPLYEEAISLRRSLSVHDKALAATLHNLAFLHGEQENWDAAEPLMLEALEICDTLPEPDPELMAQVLNNLGVFHDKHGDRERARHFYRRSVETRAVGGKRTPEDAGALDNWASLEERVGDDAAAKAVMDLFGDLLGKASGGTSFRRLSRVASLYERLGRYEEAERLLLELRRLLIAEQGQDGPEVARVQAALASVFAHQGKSVQAEPLFLEVEARMIDSPDEFSGEELQTLHNNLGLFYQQQGRTDEAEVCLRKAIAWRAATLADDDPALLDTYNNLALVYIAQRRFSDAEPILRRVLDTRRRVLIADHPHIAQSLFNLAMLYDEMDRVEEMLLLLRECLDTEDRLLANIFRVTSEEERLAYAAKLREQLDIILMRVVVRAGTSGLTELAFEGVLRRKGIVAEAGVADRLALRSEEVPAAQTLLLDLNTVRARLSRLLLDAPNDQRADGEAGRLEEQRRKLEAQLAGRLTRLKEAPVGRHAVAAALPPNSALVEFVKFALTATGVSPHEAYAAFVLRADQGDAVSVIPLGMSETIEGGIRRYRAVLLRDEAAIGRLQPEAVGRQIDYASNEAVLGAALRGIVDLLRPALGSCKRLFLAPDGLLNELPFEVLPLDDGRRLGDEFEISYLTSGRALLRFHDGAGPGSQPAVVVAAPAFDLCAGDRAESWFRPLPDTLIEGEWVAERLGVELWSDDQATEARVKAIHSPHVLHIATHGFFLDHTPRRRDAAAAARNNPLLRSGLALAGANDWFEGAELPPEAEDGLLTAEDVSSMDLSGTNLVVLSACETGLGEYRLGEGVFGLRRAFELAGARSLVMSLWRVPSGPTRELMQHFYRQLESGKRRSEALSEARRVLQRSYPEPLYWGAFVLSGDPGPIALQSSQACGITS